MECHLTPFLSSLTSSPTLSTLRTFKFHDDETMQYSGLPNHPLRPPSDSYNSDLLLGLLRARYVPDLVARQELHAFLAKERRNLPLGQEEEPGSATALCAALLAPVRQLPPEILERIFSYSVPPTTDVRYQRSPALWLGQVCKVWREAAVGTFDLTTRITLPLKERPSSSSTPSQFESLQSYLQTYPFSPLHVQLHFGPDKNQARRSFSSTQRNDLDEYIPLIMQHQRRWSKLELLDTDRYDVVPPIRQFIRMAFNSPETQCGVESPDGAISIAPAKTCASKIRELVLLTPSYSDFIPQLVDQDEVDDSGGPPSVTFSNPYNLPWTSLSSLSIRCTAPSIQHLIVLGLNLRTLKVLIDLEGDNAPTSNVLTRVTSTSIQELGMVFSPYCGPNVLSNLLSTISLPALSSLSLECKTENTHSGNIVPTSILSPFLAQSPNLDVLKVRSIPVTATTIIDSLPSAPNLRELEWDFAGIRHVDRIAEGLCLPPTPKDDIKPLVPQLTSVSLGVIQRSTAIRISSVVRSRAYRAKSAKPEHKTAALKNVTLVAWQTHHSWIQDLAKELNGLNLEEVRLLGCADNDGDHAGDFASVF